MTLEDILGMLGGQPAAQPNMLAAALQPQGVQTADLLKTLPYTDAARDALTRLPRDQIAPPLPNSSAGAFSDDPSQWLRPLVNQGGQPSPMPLAPRNSSSSIAAPAAASPSPASLVGAVLGQGAPAPAPAQPANMLDSALSSFGGAPANMLTKLFDYRDGLQAKADDTPDEVPTLGPQETATTLDPIDVVGARTAYPPARAGSPHPKPSWGDTPADPAEAIRQAIPLPPERPSGPAPSPTMPVAQRSTVATAQPNGAAVMAGFGSDVPANSQQGYHPSQLGDLQGKAVNAGQTIGSSSSGGLAGLTQGWRDGVNNALGDTTRAWLHNAFTGLATGRSLPEGLRNAAIYSAQTETQGNVNQTRQLAVSKYGLPEEVAKQMDGKGLANYVIQQQALKTKLATPDWKYQDVNGTFGRYNANDPNSTFQPVAGAPNKAPSRPLTADERKFWGIPDEDKRPYALDENRKPTVIGGSATTINIGDGEKLPSGYRWKDANNKEAGVEPIPGGPATQIPAEVAARFGLANKYIDGLNDGPDGKPGLLSRLRKGGATGANYGLGQLFSSSDAAEIIRQQQEGADALQRFLTGAGMSEKEAAGYTARYGISPTDTGESAARKAEGLRDALTSMKAAATRGRGDENNTPITPNLDHAGGAGGTTSNGLRWSVK